LPAIIINTTNERIKRVTTVILRIVTMSLSSISRLVLVLYAVIGTVMGHAQDEKEAHPHGSLRRSLFRYESLLNNNNYESSSAPDCSDLSNCGPKPGAPNYLCEDGVTMAGPGDCILNEQDNVCVWEIITCPLPDPTDPVEVSCESTKDCQPDLEYCGGGICRPMGSCESLLDCQNPNNVYASIECVGYLTCDVPTKQCSVVCTPNASMCPPGSKDVQCFASPCSVTRCGVESEFCVDYYCDFCQAIFIAPDGTRAC